ncbi:MAG: competence/damage-inducible protein A [Clostridiales bacterium]|jgi:nicotinamide-nucleotide amidase|nr:competence/damage-inducible protein A [Clostridiales bacterium]
MTAEIIAVGTELLLGDILNTNAQFLSQELAKLGVNVYCQTVVGDNADRIYAAYEAAFQRADIVIATGGLGPTQDDLTKETAARFLGREMRLDQASWEKIQAFYQSMNMNADTHTAPNSQKQAIFPEGAVILPNDNGTAPGCCVEREGKTLFLLPGPPNEAIPMYLNAVIPILKTKTDAQFVSKMLKICGVGESAAEEMIKDLIDGQTNPTIAPYAKTSEVWIRVTAKAADEAEAAEIMRPTLEEIRRRLGDHVYGEDEDTLEGVAVKRLLEKKLTIACAESCTGGALTAKLVDCPGVSGTLLEGAVTYSNEAKMRRLNVRAETLQKYGAVSAETAAEMARGAAETAGADIGVATTGVAGPGGGSLKKPVGLVYLGLHYRSRTSVKELRLAGDRQKIRARTVVNALDMIRRRLLEEEEEE